MKHKRVELNIYDIHTILNFENYIFNVLKTIDLLMDIDKISLHISKISR